MSTQQIFGWGAWVVLLLFAVSWSVGCYLYIRRGAGISQWTFYYAGMNKLHLFWLAPSVVPVALLTTISRALSTVGEKRMMPPGLFVLLVGYGLVLLWLTD